MAMRVLELTACTVDLVQRVVHRDTGDLHLTAREADLLGYLAERPGVAVSREELLVEVWGYAPHVASRAVDATASRVRDKIEGHRDQPEHLLTVHGSGYCFVPSRVHATVRTNVVPRRGRFLGRQSAIAALVPLLDEVACLTIVGPPGAGKTTTAQVLAEQVLATSDTRGVWFCTCAGDRTYEGLVATVAATLQIGPSATTAESAAQIGHALAGAGPSVVVLDNFEQLVHTVRDTICQWMDQAAEARFVVTSRERLNIAGERVFPLPPLDQAAGQELLLALAHDAGLPAPAVGQEQVLADVVARLDGLPLAIELAAARLPLLGPTGLLERLDQRLTVLRSRRQDQDARQVTMQAALDWSWDLLDPGERLAWAQCAVFRSPFPADAAEAVLDVEGRGLDALHSLVDKCLLTVRGAAAGTAPRFRMLESLAAYAEWRLGDLGDRGEIDRDALERRHARWFSMRRLDHDPTPLPDLMAAAERGLEDGDIAVAVGAIRAANAVLERQGPRGPVAALAARALEHASDDTLRGQLQLVLAGAHQLAGRLGEARAAYEAVADVVGTDPAILGAALLGLGQVAQRQGDLTEASGHLERAVELLSGPPEGWARARLGVVRMRSGDLDKAREEADRALGLARVHHDTALEAFVLANQVAVALRQGQLQEAVELGDQAIAAARGAGDLRMEAIAAGNLGAAQATRGALDEAAAHYGRALALHRAAGNRPGACSTLANLGDLELSRGRLSDAERHLSEALALAISLQARRQEGLARLNLGILYLKAGRVDDAIAAFEGARGTFESIGVPRLAAIALSHRGEAATLAGQDAIADLSAAIDTLEELGDSLQAALSRCRRATAQRGRGAPQRAQADLEVAAATARRLGLGDESELAQALRAANGTKP